MIGSRTGVEKENFNPGAKGVPKIIGLDSSSIISAKNWSSWLGIFDAAQNFPS
jgi:hypothetical protein